MRQTIGSRRDKPDESNEPCIQDITKLYDIKIHRVDLLIFSSVSEVKNKKNAAFTHTGNNGDGK